MVRSINFPSFLQGGVPDGSRRGGYLRRICHKKEQKAFYNPD